jgi:uncharacterized delta-60 repeat protein
MPTRTPPVAALPVAVAAVAVALPLALAACDDDVLPPPPQTDLAAAPDLLPASTSDGGAAAPMPRPVIVSPTGHDRLLGVTRDAAGNIYAVGYAATGTDAAADFSVAVAKLDPSGALDPTFGQGGFAVKNAVVGTGGEVARGIVVQSTGKIVVSATVEHAGQPATDPRDRDTALIRFNANGTVDTSFGDQGVKILDLSDGEVVSGGYVADTTYGLSKYPGADDRMVMVSAKKRTGGTDLDFAVVRVDADGNLDPSFNGTGVFTLDINNLGASPRMATTFADGSVIASGYVRDTADNDVVKPVIMKLTNGGALDPTFGGGKGYFFEKVLNHTTEVYSVALQGDKLVTIGYGKDAASDDLDWVSLRLDARGALDPTWGAGGKVIIDRAGFDDNARDVVVLPDNRVIFVGGGRSAMGNSDAMIALVTASGAPDLTFGIDGKLVFDLGGASDFFWAAALSPARDAVAIVGAKQVAAGAGNDDGALLVLPIGR